MYALMAQLVTSWRQLENTVSMVQNQVESFQSDVICIAETCLPDFNLAPTIGHTLFISGFSDWL